MANAAGSSGSLASSSVIVPRLSPTGKASSSEATPSVAAPASASESVGTALSLEHTAEKYIAAGSEGAPSEWAPSEFATGMSPAMTADEYDNSSLMGDDREQDDGWDLLTDDQPSATTSEDESD
jgi:hypothetical protein